MKITVIFLGILHWYIYFSFSVFLLSTGFIKIQETGSVKQNSEKQFSEFIVFDNWKKYFLIFHAFKKNYSNQLNCLMKKTPVKVILIDDHKIIRNLYKNFLESSGQFIIIADFADSIKAIEEIKNLEPDLILVDINMLPVNGFFVTEHLLKHNPSLKIIGLSINNLPSYARRMITLGAKGYLTKTSPVDEVIEGLMEVYNGKNFICAEVRKNMKPEDTM